ncbi:MAG: hypothetical protein AB1644_10565 [Candidatus Zixiibacteriota bacterium]
MKKALLAGIVIMIPSMILLSGGCDKEKIVNSKEYIHDIEYIQLPPDTVLFIDTVYNNDSVIITRTDTIRIHDTVRTTVYVYDTITTVHNFYDTVVVHDTVVRTLYAPNSPHAVAAMEYQTDPLVLDFILQQFGMTDGWVYYLSPSQMEIVQVSTNVYDIYAYVDYWAADFSGYYPLEVYWRLTYTSGDPANPNNWQMTDPPAAVAGHKPGIAASSKAAPAQLLNR